MPFVAIQGTTKKDDLFFWAFIHDFDPYPYPPPSRGRVYLYFFFNKGRVKEGQFLFREIISCFFKLQYVF
jgi:hypothetical protein